MLALIFSLPRSFYKDPEIGSVFMQIPGAKVDLRRWRAIKKKKKEYFFIRNQFYKN